MFLNVNITHYERNLCFKGHCRDCLSSSRKRQTFAADTNCCTSNFIFKIVSRASSYPVNPG